MSNIFLEDEGYITQEDNVRTPLIESEEISLNEIDETNLIQEEINGEEILRVTPNIELPNLSFNVFPNMNYRNHLFIAYYNFIFNFVNNAHVNYFRREVMELYTVLRSVTEGWLSNNFTTTRLSSIQNINYQLVMQINHFPNSQSTNISSGSTIHGSVTHNIQTALQSLLSNIQVNSERYEEEYTNVLGNEILANILKGRLILRMYFPPLNSQNVAYGGLEYKHGLDKYYVFSQKTLKNCKKTWAHRPPR